MVYVLFLFCYIIVKKICNDSKAWFVIRSIFDIRQTRNVVSKNLQVVDGLL